MLNEFNLSSSAFKHTENIPQKYTADGLNINPPLQWNGAPFDIQSYALLVDDPDAVEGYNTHWIVKNIPPDVNSIEENSVPGIELTNSFGKKSYCGPDIPYGNHRYFFRLFALNTSNIEEGDIHHIYRQLEKHKLSEAHLMGRYVKK